MIRMPPFDLLVPTSTPEVLDALAHADNGTRVLAGGTDLLVNIKQGHLRPQRLVWLGKVPDLREVTFSTESGLQIGAMCTLDEVASSATIQRYYPALSSAARSVASPAIRNTATLGGNLCQDTRCFYYNQSEPWRQSLGGCLKAELTPGVYGSICHAAQGWPTCSAVFCSDTAPVLIALDASVTLLSSNGERTIKLSELYREDGMHHLALNPGEVLAFVVLPPPREDVRAVHRKIRSRQSIDFALANVGIAVSLTSGKICEEAKIVVGAVESRPVEARDAARTLVGSKLTAERIARVAKETAESVTPLPNVDERVSYRKSMVQVLVERALAELHEEESH